MKALSPSASRMKRCLRCRSHKVFRTTASTVSEQASSMHGACARSGRPSDGSVVIPVHIRPGRSIQMGMWESFHRRVRDECPSVYRFHIRRP